MRAMKISLNWIKEFTDLPSKYSAKELAGLLTLRTCEVEGYEEQKAQFSNMVVGKTIKTKPHPNADKLRLVETDVGGGTVQIVCGGQNLTEGMLVAVALPGAIVKWHGTEIVELKETKIRGEHSFGMICAGEEIGLPAAPQNGITDLGALLAQFDIKPPKIGMPLAQALGLDDTIFEIDNKSLTHRPDLWGHYGMAREFSAFLSKKLKPFAPKIKLSAGGEKITVKVEKAEICKRFLSVIVSGVKVEKSPVWLIKRLEAVGMRPVNNIVDITNYVMHELGHPMHAFDRKIVKTDKFVIRYARENEIIETLDHKKRRLSKEDALVTNGENALAIAGVMGGANSEINPNTTEIILEVATWNPVLIRKTSQRHALRTDAAQRFEKSLDPEIALLAFRRACELIAKLCPGAKFGQTADYYPKKDKPIAVLLDTEKAKNKIGSRITEKEMAAHLKALGFGVAKAKKGNLKITVPSFRATKDINIEDDLVEEISRMHGYEKIVPALPNLPTKLPIVNTERVQKHRARQLLSLGLGFCETNHYSFYGSAEIKKCMLPEALHITPENPLTEDQTHLRISLLPNLLKSIALNLNSREEAKLYEIGRTYIKTEKYFPVEEKFICCVMVRPFGKLTTGAAHHDREIFYDGLGAAQTFLERFNAPAFTTQIPDGIPPYAHPAKCAAIMIGNKEIGIVYEIHPAVLKNFGIEKQCVAFEINFTKLVAQGQKDIAYRPIPRFPGIEIDVSILASCRIEARTLQDLIKQSAGPLMADLKLIDTFEGAALGEGKKSFTFRILLQSPDRTLTDEEMKQVQNSVFKTLQSGGFEIRGLK